MRTYLHLGTSGIAVALVAAVAHLVGCGDTRGEGSEPLEEMLPPSGTPQILLVVPDRGDVAGGEVLTIVASGFQDDFAANPPLVHFGSLVQPATAVDPGVVEVVTPPCPEGAVDLILESVGIPESAILEDGFAYREKA